MRVKKIVKDTYHENSYIFSSDTVEIVLYNRNREEKARTVVDKDDYFKVRRYKWCTNGRYVESKTTGESVLLHRLIIDAKNTDEVDHKDGNKLNNRKSNLRFCTRGQNNWNRPPSRKNTSGVTGVCKCAQTGKWAAEARVNGKRIWLGRFERIEDAIAARQESEKEYFGEFRWAK